MLRGIFESWPVTALTQNHLKPKHTLTHMLSLLPYLHLDEACSNCSFGAICDAQSGRCVCTMECVDSHQPVCGSDGTTYNSECELHVRACMEQMDLRVVSQGECSKCIYAECAYLLFMNPDNKHRLEVFLAICINNQRTTGFSGSQLKVCKKEKAQLKLGHLIRERGYFSLKRGLIARGSGVPRLSTREMIFEYLIQICILTRRIFPFLQ